MLITTYFPKIKQIPDDYIKLIITRFPPKWLDISKYPNTYIMKNLAPLQEILLDYKKDKDWNRYVERFNNQMSMYYPTANTIRKLGRGLQKGKKYAVICYEKDYIHCHRSLLAEKIKDSFNIEWKEL